MTAVIDDFAQHGSIDVNRVLHCLQATVLWTTEKSLRRYIYPLLQFVYTLLHSLHFLPCSVYCTVVMNGSYVGTILNP